MNQYAVIYHNRIWLLTPNLELAKSHARLVADEQDIETCVVILSSLKHIIFDPEL